MTGREGEADPRGTGRLDWAAAWDRKNRSQYDVHEPQRKHGLALELLEGVMRREVIRSVCDFGCGPGVLLDRLRRDHSHLDLCGADQNTYSKRALQSLGIPYVTIDLACDRVTFDVDVGLLVDVLEHFHDPRVVLRNVSRVRRLIVVVPNFSFVTERISVVRGDVPFQMRINRIGHMFWFNARTLPVVAREAGYRVIERRNTYPDALRRVPFVERFENMTATALGVTLERS